MKKKTLVFSLLMSACVFVKAQYANQTLSNLTAPTAVNKDLRPGTHDAYNLGEPSKSWKNVSLTGILYLKSEPFLRVLGTGGTFIGTKAGGSTTGSFNTGLGFQALYYNTTGSSNTAGGFQSLYTNVSGNRNTAYGYQALFLNTTGDFNTANGAAALQHNTNGYWNSAIGAGALSANTIGNRNTALGYIALNKNTTGLQNSAIGSEALNSNTTGDNNTAVGASALYSNTTGEANTAIGVAALQYNTSGRYNSAFGGGTLVYNTTGYFNTAVGNDVLSSNTIGNYNTAIGSDALTTNTTGTANNAFGTNALYHNSRGYNNAAFGTATLVSLIEGFNNTAVGASAGQVIADNIAQPNATFSNCTFLGANTTVERTTQYNTTVIGYNAHAAADNQVVVGNTSVNSIGGYANWTNFSDGRYKKNVKEDVPGLSFIKQLRAVTYTLDIDGVNKTNTPAGKAQMPKDEKFAKFATVNEEASKKEIELANKAVTEKSKIVYTGFVAQEVEAAAKKLDYDFSGVKKPANDGDFYGLRYAEFVVPLVKAVQELSVENEDIKKQNDDLKLQNQKLESRLAAIEQMLGGKNGLGLVTLSNNSLGQNIPNPANGKMTIPFNLSSVYQRATIVITEVASGKTLKTIAVTPGQKAVTVQLDNMASGTYAYSLIANNKTLDSKKMVVAR